MALDNFLHLRPAEPMDERITIVGITEDDITRAKTYPIPDREIATLIKKIENYQPRVIGLDLVRNVSVEPGHKELVDVYGTGHDPAQRSVGVSLYKNFTKLLESGEIKVRKIGVI